MTEMANANILELLAEQAAGSAYALVFPKEKQLGLLDELPVREFLKCLIFDCFIVSNEGRQEIDPSTYLQIWVNRLNGVLPLSTGNDIFTNASRLFKIEEHFEEIADAIFVPQQSEKLINHYRSLV